MEARRIDELDWLRGLMALAILVYHSATFANIGWNADASTVLGKLGIYGVSIFFVLSGLSMAHVYHSSLSRPKAIGGFFLRRAFRIWPLLALVVCVKAVEDAMTGRFHSPLFLAASATGAFGFIAPHAYMNVGAWSIGNEMVFYALTPALLYAFDRNKVLGNAIVGLCTIVGGIFAFSVLDPARTLASQWVAYVNPLNNLFLYASGVALFYNLRDLALAGWSRAAVLILPVLAFAAYPSGGDQIHIVTGAGRVALSALSVLIVAGFYRAAPSLPAPAAAALTRIGVISYGVYLLHPFMIDGAKGVTSHPIALLSIVIGATLAISLVVYTALEKPMNDLGRALARKLKTPTYPPIRPRLPTPWSWLRRH